MPEHTTSNQPIPLFDTLENFSITKPNFSSGSLPLFAPDDYRAAYDYLAQYTGNSATFSAYRREVERLLHWAWIVKKQSVLSLKNTDITDYVAFCQSPLESWIGHKNAPRFMDKEGLRIPNPEWKPFTMHQSKNAVQKKDKYQISQKAIREIFTILSSFYSYLQYQNKVNSNPVAMVRQKSKFLRKVQTTQQVRRLSELQWSYVIETAKLMAEQEPDVHERTLFIVSALYLMYLRISELGASERWEPQMRNFYKDNDNFWWFVTIGKGNKERHITVCDDMLVALKRWRTYLGLSPLPSPSDSSPLLPRLQTQTALVGTRHIRTLVQHCFDRAANRLVDDGLREDAEILREATVHWLRHTGISDDINRNHRPITHVRDDAGHSSSMITDRYNDINLRERHLSGEKKKLDGLT